MEELFIRHYRMETSSSDTSSDASIVHPYKNSQAKQAAGGCQPHGNLTPAHADGCAARCFEGVQCGSIFKGAGGRGPQSTALFLKNACVAPSCPEIMAGVLPRLAPARMYLSALCSAAAAAPFSRCSLGSLSACTGHQPLDGRCTRIKKPLAVRRKFGPSFCNNFTRFLPICAPRSFYNGRRKQGRCCIVSSIF